jgi:hypothetical protein
MHLMDYPFDTVGLSGETVDLFLDTYTTLQQKFDIQPTGNIDFHLEDFELFRNYTSISLRGSFVIKNSRTDCYILFAELTYVTPNTSREGDAHHKEYQTWALAYLKHDFGRVLIRKETLADKLIELVHPIEIDFPEDKAFSDTFYVVANDFNKAFANIGRDFRNAVMDVRHDDFLIEISDHTLIIGDKKPVFPGRAMHLADFVTRLCSNC